MAAAGGGGDGMPGSRPRTSPDRSTGARGNQSDRPYTASQPYMVPDRTQLVMAHAAALKNSKQQQQQQQQQQGGKAGAAAGGAKTARDFSTGAGHIMTFGSGATLLAKPTPARKKAVAQPALLQRRDTGIRPSTSLPALVYMQS